MTKSEMKKSYNELKDNLKNKNFLIEKLKEVEKEESERIEKVKVLLDRIESRYGVKIGTFVTRKNLSEYTQMLNGFFAKYEDKDLCAVRYEVMIDGSV